MAQYKIRPINTGYTSTSKGLYLYHHSTHRYYKDLEGKVQLPCFAYLIEGEGKLIMVDTGMSNTEIADKYHHPGSVQPEGYAIHDQLAKLGIKPADINLVIFTHLHWDHCYNMKKFANARFVVQKKEYEFALNPIPIYYKSYEHPSLGLTRQFEGVKFDLVDGEKEIIDGIRVFPGPGHSPGHQSVEIDTAKGKYICCGDAIFVYDNLKSVPEINYEITPPARCANIVECWNSIVELKSRAKEREFILPCHELLVEKLVEKQPILP